MRLKIRPIHSVYKESGYSTDLDVQAPSYLNNFLGYTEIGMSNLTVISSTSPLKRIIHAIHAIEKGEYTSELLRDLAAEQGDLGKMARSVDAMAHHISLRENQLNLLRRVIPIGVSLSAERDFNRLLETLVVEAQSFTNADAGSLYLVEDKKLKFMILRNASLKMQMGGTSRDPIPFSPVPMYNDDGKENRSNVVSYAALTHKRINIADAYQAEGFDFSGTKAFDEQTKYRSKSFLTMPLANSEGMIIGVLQLINAKDAKTGEIIPFEDSDELEALVLLATAALDGYILEMALRQEIAQLKIEINESRRASQVAEITESKFFKDLRSKAEAMRTKSKK